MFLKIVDVGAVVGCAMQFKGWKEILSQKIAQVKNASMIHNWKRDDRHT